MKAQITEKINTKTIQFVWETQVLYLQIREYEDGRRAYSIKDFPEDGISSYATYIGVGSTSSCVISSSSCTIPVNSFSISIPSGKLEVNYDSKGIKKQLEASKNTINNNIQYLNRIQEILDYIAELEKNNKSE